jgi:hypothetical protein
VCREQIPPAPIAEPRGACGRVDDVGEQHRHELPSRGVRAANAGQELLDLLDSRRRILEREVIAAGNLDVARAWPTMSCTSDAMKRIFTKIGVHDRAQAVIAAYEARLVAPAP